MNVHRTAECDKACYMKQSSCLVFRIDSGRACVTHHVSSADCTFDLGFALHLDCAVYLLLDDMHPHRINK